MSDAIGRLDIPLGEAIYTQRAIRRFKPDPIPVADLEVILEAASKAPNGGNNQRARFLVVTDRQQIREFGALYHKAWWAKRFDSEGISGPEEMTEEQRKVHAAPMRLADDMKDAPCIVFALSLPPNFAESVYPACQNLMLAARALGIGSVPTRLHPTVLDEFRALFDIPPEVVLHFTIPLGYPAGRFGPTKRRPTWETSYFDKWGAPVPWAPTP